MGVSRTNSFIELIGLIFIFIFILIAAYFVSKWVGISGVKQAYNKNMRIVETLRVSPGKYIQIVKTGSKYLVLGISKDHIEYLTELEEEQLEHTEMPEINQVNFRDIFEKIKKDKQNKNN